MSFYSILSYCIKRLPGLSLLSLSLSLLYLESLESVSLCSIPGIGSSCHSSVRSIPRFTDYNIQQSKSVLYLLKATFLTYSLCEPKNMPFSFHSILFKFSNFKQINFNKKRNNWNEQSIILPQINKTNN